MLFVGCASNRYHIMLAIAANEYHPEMSWIEIREVSSKEFYRSYTLRVFDSAGNAIPLYRYAHESSQIIPLDEAEIHIGTPIIIPKKYKMIYLKIFNHGIEVSKISVVIEQLKTNQGRDKALIIPIMLSQKE
jgi:hypothetical protein